MIRSIERETEIDRSRLRDQLASMGIAPVDLSGLEDYDILTAELRVAWVSTLSLVSLR